MRHKIRRILNEEKNKTGVISFSIDSPKFDEKYVIHIKRFLEQNNIRFINYDDKNVTLSLVIDKSQIKLISDFLKNYGFIMTSSTFTDKV